MPDSRLPTPDSRLPSWLAELDLDVPRLEQYFGPWAILETHFRAAVDRVKTLDLRVHVAESGIGSRESGIGKAAAGGDGSRSFAMTSSGVAVISLSGALMKQASSLSNSTSTVRARRQIRDAMADDDVTGICLVIDSPGGTVAGTGDLAADVAAAAAKKKTVAYVADLCASAAYWIGSQTQKIVANPTALVGSIGTYAVLQDESGAAAKDGIKVHVVRAGDFKGMGTPGTEISAAQLGEMQRTIDALNEHFVRGVASGRKMTLAKTRELADGRVHIASEAQTLGLIDAVGTLDETLADLGRKPTSKPTSSSKGKAMSDSAPAAASYDDLAANLPGADAEFIVSQLKAKATVQQAVSNWMAEQNARLAKAQAAADQAKADAAKAQADAQKKDAKPGVAAVTGGGKAGAASESSDDPIAAFNDAVAAEMRGKTGATAKRRAIAAVVAKQPELHAAYIEAFNSDRAYAKAKGNSNLSLAID